MPGWPFHKTVWGFVVALALLMPAPGVAKSRHSDRHVTIDAALQLRLDSNTPQQVIVRSRPGKKDAVKKKLAGRTGQVREHALIEAVTVRLTPAQIRELAEDSDVEGLSLDAEIESSGSASSTSETASVLKQTLGMSDWFTGSTVTVALIDSGIAPVADFDTRIVGTYDFTNGKLGVRTLASDEYGHGTHVAGLIGSNGSTSAGKYSGVAPGVKLVALKVLDKKGAGKTSDVIAALDFAVANRAALGIRIINLSLGHPVYESAKTDPLVLAVESAVRSGLIVVVAAGNYGTNPTTGVTGYGGIASPGNAPSAITVGSANTKGTLARGDDRLAPYSSRGPSWYDGIAKPDVLAPGDALVSNDAPGSTLEINYPGLVVRSVTGAYLKLSGSSMAAGVVSGLIAVTIEANEYGAQKRWQDYQTTLKRSLRTPYVAPPPLTSNAIKAMLQFSATPIRNESGAAYGPLEQGTGLVNGLGAVELAYYVDTSKAAGQFWLTTTGFPYSTPFGGVEQPWAQQVIWGTRLLGGTSVVELNQSGWARNVVWGTGEDDNVVWGTASADDDNVVWGTSADDDNVVWGTSVPISLDLAWAGNATLTENVVWGAACPDDWDDNVVWGTGLIGYFDGTTVIWGASSDEGDNVVWGTLSDDNVVWGTSDNKVTVLGTMAGGGL